MGGETSGPSGNWIPSSEALTALFPMCMAFSSQGSLLVLYDFRLASQGKKGPQMGDCIYGHSQSSQMMKTEFGLGFFFNTFALWQAAAETR